MIRQLNVYEAVQRRLKVVFDTFEYVYVSFSGGKDSELNDALHQENLRQIKEAVKDINEPTVLLAFGNNIGLRPYLKTCLRDIVTAMADKRPHYVSVGTPTNWGNPRHPLYAGYRELTDFDIDAYLTTIRS